MFRYPAFLSYSRRDLDFARKLHAQLEAYRIPKNAGESKHSKKGDRISPIFRDQDEVSASSNLGDTLTNALANSSAMIVIASPEAAASKWVNAEVEQFSKLGRAGRVFVAIPPYISTDRSFDVRDIFPPALLALGEPLAADFRKTCDGWTLAKLKLIAGVAGLDLVRLRDRDAARRLRNMVVSTVAAVAIVGVLGATGWSALQAQYRAKQERVARSLEGIRTAMIADQPGSALALIDSVNRGDVSPEIAAGLDRLRQFWSEHLLSPRESLSAMPVGTQFVFGNARYFRSGTSVVPLPAAGVAYSFQSRLSNALIIEDERGGFTRLDPSSGSVTTLLSDPPPNLITEVSRVYERPDGTLLVTWGGGGGGGMGGQYYVATVIYPDGSNAGVLQTAVFTDLHADANCTRLYFADGNKGYGRPTAGSPNPNFSQVLYSGFEWPDELTEVSDVPLSLNVATLGGEADWREGEVQRPQGTDFELFAMDWLASRGASLDEACAQYALEGSYIPPGEVRPFSIPMFTPDLLRRDNSVSPASVWASQRWISAAVQEETPEIDIRRAPDDFAETDAGRFVVFTEFVTGANTSALVVLACHQPNNADSRCRRIAGTSDYGVTLLPRAGVIAMGGEFGIFDFATMTSIPWPGFAGSTEVAAESADGRTIMAITPAGEIAVFTHTPGSAPTTLRTINNSNYAGASGLAVLDETDALIVTHEGRIMRVDTTSGAIEWTIQTAVGNGVNLAAVSPNRHFALIATATGVQLFEMSVGAPLTRFYQFADAGVRNSSGRRRFIVTDDGAITIGIGSVGLVRAAPRENALPESDRTCLYGARIVDGRAVAVDVIGDSAIRSQCGLDNLSPPP